MVDRSLATRCSPPRRHFPLAFARAGLAGSATIEIPARLPDRAKRPATVEMRFARWRSAVRAAKRTGPCPNLCGCRWSMCARPPAGGSRSHSLAAADHARGRGRGGGLADRGLVPDAMEHRAIVPGDEIARFKSGGKPADHRETFDKADGGEGRLSGHTVGAGTRWQTWAARRDRVLEAGDRYNRGPQSHPGGQDRATAQSTPTPQPGKRRLGHGTAWRLELLLRTTRSNYHTPRPRKVQINPQGGDFQIDNGTRYETRLVRRRGKHGGGADQTWIGGRDNHRSVVRPLSDRGRRVRGWVRRRKTVRCPNIY